MAHGDAHGVVTAGDGLGGKAVSLGGDSDTLACITGGIAEAFYKEIPKAMAEKVQNLLPEEFVRVLASVRENTVYGTVCKISE